MQKFNLFILISLLFVLPGCAQETTPDPDRQIGEAVNAAPEDQRELGFQESPVGEGCLGEQPRLPVRRSDHPGRVRFFSQG